MSLTPVNQCPPRILTRFILSAVLLAAVSCGAESTAGDLAMAQVQAVIRSRLAGKTMPSSLTCQGEMICGVQMLPLAYRSRNYLPLWFDATLRLEAAEALDEAIHHAVDDGLVPADYHSVFIHHLLADICERLSVKAPIPPEMWADLELILSDAFLLYGSHLAAGRVDPETLHSHWMIDPGSVALLPSLIQAASAGDVEAALDELRPTHSGYTALRNALARYHAVAVAGGWPVVADHRTLRPGDRSPAVGDLRRRLVADGDMDPSVADDDALYFDGRLAAAVKRFQQRHGLEPDGIVGYDTYAMLNVSVERRIRQLALNLERWRWLPRELGGRFIMVNTADFRLEAMEDGRVALQMRVVVGRPARRSPVFSARMTYLVINPYWNVPTTIAVEDILPEIQKDVGYLAQRRIRVYQSWNPDAAEIDPAAVDWQDYHADRFPFKLRQDPGPYNALGRIKFMFANEFAVYLHDTPDRSLFRRIQRDLSSGCIRVEAPLALAEFVLADHARWTPAALTELIEKGATKTIGLEQPIPVHLLYMTAWTDESGVTQFRNDFYNRDAEMDRALSRPRPARPAYWNPAE